ncbi:MAG: UDP-2,4-diacetamido-2,4,6-trideoxy-beta-L-altropyranose hydrolase [Sulfurimonas sp.]|uniref:UDP-2,4-diacetamido-2,4, 6-trideoxy-beta-L-altropyranose hydrolase n=1 Tax=Sulfurimonas sp. TaxID=2022749 RepID=UPI0025D92B6D|nr:UDP-2,4-diacetamido-2,4,6-trideoxy-beta-L-altropyranose hydrolase [Sulfurimonas sp.]MCK9492377.1 UDP-2,4-diacetamido-2,4,6-trideoxy-beta-L-altropyranose hydrolase [Sulfurimonas sp.]
MKILFRADSSSTIGTGHIMRDLVLAKKYAKKDHNIIFATQDLSGNINHKILEDGYKLVILKSNSLKELDAQIKKLDIDMLVVDHYRIDYKFEKKLKIQNPKLKILSFDDTYEKHYCDILLNHNISADKTKYKVLVPNRCVLRCGAKYTLLRDEFFKEKKKQKKKLKIKNSTFKIFVAMGGADTANLNIKILKELKKIKNIKVNLVTTTANQHLDLLEKYTKKKSWINLQVNSNKVAKLMAKSDFAIVTPSVTVNEVYYMELAFIAIKTADNQEDMYKFLKSKGYLVLSRFDKIKFQNHISKMLRNLQ